MTQCDDCGLVFTFLFLARFPSLLLRRRYIQIDFKSMRVNLSLPPSVTCKSGAIRAAWLNFDHFSDYSYTFSAPRGRSSLGETDSDLLAATRREWKVRRGMTKNLAKKKPSKIGNVDGEALAQCAPFLDVEKLYTEIAERKTNARLQRLAPSAFQMKEFELNLRKYRVVGGIYSIEYFEQPQQNIKLSSNSFLRMSICGSSASHPEFKGSLRLFQAPQAKR